MGRDALKQRSQGRVLEAQHRARQHQPPVYMTPPPRHQPPPQQPQQWRITGDMMNQLWGALLLRLLVPHPTPAFHLSHLRRRQCIAYSASMTCRDEFLLCVELHRRDAPDEAYFRPVCVQWEGRDQCPW